MFESSHDPSWYLGLTTHLSLQLFLYQLENTTFIRLGTCCMQTAPPRNPQLALYTLAAWKPQIKPIWNDLTIWDLMLFMCATVLCHFPFSVSLAQLSPSAPNPGIHSPRRAGDSISQKRKFKTVSTWNSLPLASQGGHDVAHVMEKRFMHAAGFPQLSRCGVWASWRRFLLHMPFPGGC